MPFKPFESMETERLLFRPLTPDDCQALFGQMLSDPETMQDLAIARHTDAWMTHEYITESMLGWRHGTRFRYGLFGKESGELSAIVELTPRLPQVELGVVISRKGGTRRRRDGIIALKQLLDWSRLEDEQRVGLVQRVGACSRAWQFARQVAPEFPGHAGCLSAFLAAIVVWSALLWAPLIYGWRWWFLTGFAGCLAAAV